MQPRLKWLEMEAFRSFVKKVKIEFPPNGTMLIRGENPVTGDASGTGKSSILLGISYALDMCHYSASELQSWPSLTDKDMQVRLCLETDLGEVVISRGKKNNIKVGDRTVTSAKAIAEELKNVIGLDSDTLAAITYRRQKKNGLFLSLTDGEKKEFLTKLLGLGKIEDAVDQSEALIKTMSASALTLEPQRTALEKELLTLKGQEFPSETSAQEFKDQEQAFKNELVTVQGNIKALQDRVKAIQGDVGGDAEVKRLVSIHEAAGVHHGAAIGINQTLYREFQANQELLRRKFQDITRRDTLKLGIVQNIEVQEKALRHALEGKCSTCFRTWDQAGAKAEECKAVIANYQAQLQSLVVDPVEKKRVEDELRVGFTHDPNIAKLAAVIADVEGQISRRRNELISGPTAETQSALNTLNTKKAVLESQVYSIRQQIKTIEDSNARFVQARVFAERNLAATQAKYDQFLASTAGANERINAERDFVALMGREGFLGVIFDDVLKEIENDTNDRLARLANVSHVTIQFKSESLTQKGTVKRSILPIAYVNGQETKLDAGLSGGMYTSVEGQVDLAVMAVVQRRTGTLPGFLLLDESFEGQGSKTKEAVMEVLKEYSQEKLVIVIDHNSEFKELFTQHIDVTFDGFRSEIK